MCVWCDPNENTRKAEYNINGVKFSINLEGNELIVYRYSQKLGNRADVAFGFPINYCPMCGAMFLEDDEDEEE